MQSLLTPSSSSRKQTQTHTHTQAHTHTHNMHKLSFFNSHQAGETTREDWQRDVSLVPQATCTCSNRWARGRGWKEGKSCHCLSLILIISFSFTFSISFSLSPSQSLLSLFLSFLLGHLALHIYTLYTHTHMPTHKHIPPLHPARKRQRAFLRRQR